MPKGLSHLHQYIICQNWHWLLWRLKFQTAICNGSHDVLMMSMDLKDIDILNICAVDHCCIITGITNSEDMNLLINADLSEKSGSL